MTRHTMPFALAILALAPHALAQTAAPPSGPAVVARGEATVKRAPDQARVTIASESRAATAAEAQRLAAEAMTTVQKALAKTSLPGDAIKTTNYSMQPDLEWTNGRSRVKGYIVRNEIEVRVDDMSKLSSVIDAAGASGATSMSNLQFDLKDRAGAEREALRLAVQDAMERAKAMAAGAQASLGPILRVEERLDDSSPRPMPMQMRMTQTAGAAPTPVSPGDVGIRAEVFVTVAIK